jgi:hypothetical protein
MQSLKEQGKGTIIETAAWTLSFSLGAFSSLSMGYYSRELFSKSLHEIRESGPAELKFPCTEYPGNLNQLIEEYSELTLKSINSGYSSTTIRFRE